MQLVISFLICLGICNLLTPNFWGEAGLLDGTGSIIGEEKVNFRDCLTGDSAFDCPLFVTCSFNPICKTGSSDFGFETGSLDFGCETGSPKLNFGIELTGSVKLVCRSGKITF